MPETVQDVVNRELRENKRYTGDGLPNEPVGAPLPVGDPQSGVHNPKKVNLRKALLAPVESAASDADRAKDEADRAEVEAAKAEQAAESAEDDAAIANHAKNAAIAASEASGDVLFFDTYADAYAALNDLDEGQVVRVFEDENHGEDQTFYRVESGDLVFKYSFASRRNSVRRRFVSAEGQVEYSGADAEGLELSYEIGNVDIFANGVKLSKDQYTANDGQTVTLTSGLPLNSTLDVLSFSSFLVADTYSKSEVDALIAASRTPPNIQVFAASGMWVKPIGLSRVKVTVIGGGAGAGGAAATDAGQASGSRSGSGGATAIKVIEAAELSATEVVTVGLGGTAGGAGNTAGGAGGESSFGSHCAAGGGSAGIGQGATSNVLFTISPAPPGASGGDINIPGGGAGILHRNGPTANGGFSGPGGGTSLAPPTRVNVNSVGLPGNYPGGGACGAHNAPEQTNRSGAAGADGIVIVEEFF